MRLEIQLKREIKQTSKGKREPRTGGAEGEMECSLFEWLSALSLRLSLSVFRFECARAE